MLPSVQPRPRSLNPYHRVLDADMLDHLHDLAAPLRGARIVHLNATAMGGGVAEILATLIPLLRSVGVHAQWRVLPPDDGFFEVTKRLHNWLQGKSGHLSKADRETYIAYSERVAKQLRNEDADVWVVHDPQPLALRTMVPLCGPAIWRCHIDCS